MESLTASGLERKPNSGTSKSPAVLEIRYELDGLTKSASDFPATCTTPVSGSIPIVAIRAFPGHGTDIEMNGLRWKQFRQDFTAVEKIQKNVSAEIN